MPKFEIGGLEGGENVCENLFGKKSIMYRTNLKVNCGSFSCFRGSLVFSDNNYTGMTEHLPFTAIVVSKFPYEF